MLLYSSDDYPDGLNDFERTVRDEMIYVFNPSLKSILVASNPEVFTQYAFNTCRQTAIFGAYYLMHRMPGYEIKAFEGLFEEPGRYSDYLHCFITADNGNGQILIDLARTEKPLIFHRQCNYPDKYGYDVMNLKDFTMLDIIDLISMNTGEFFTSMKPRDFMYQLMQTMQALRTQYNPYEYAMETYKRYTFLIE